jgi:hypothetical protein
MADHSPDNLEALHEQRDWLLVTLSSIGDAVDNQVDLCRSPLNPDGGLSWPYTYLVGPQEVSTVRRGIEAIFHR